MTTPQLSDAVTGAARDTFTGGVLDRARRIADDLVTAPERVHGLAGRRSSAEVAELLSELVCDARVQHELLVELVDALLALEPSGTADGGRCGPP